MRCKNYIYVNKIINGVLKQTMIMCDNKNFMQSYKNGKKIRICKRCGAQHGVKIEVEEPKYIKPNFIDIILGYIYRFWNKIKIILGR